MDQAIAPRGRIWRKPSEGLAFGCTAKGKKVGTGGEVLHLFVAISYGKGVVLAKAYKKLNARKFSSFVRRYFPRTIKACGTIPPRSPDLIPIENVFNNAGAMLRKDAVRKRIQVERFADFKKCIIRTFNDTCIIILLKNKLSYIYRGMSNWFLSVFAKRK